MKKLLLLFLALNLTAGAEPQSGKKAEPKLHDVTVTEAEAALKSDKKLVVIDVRTADEFKAGHLKDATNIDVKGKDFQAQVEKLDRNKTYLVHCRSGGRSAKAMKTFKELGFTNVLHLKDGYLGWTEQHSATK